MSYWSSCSSEQKRLSPESKKSKLPSPWNDDSNKRHDEFSDLSAIEDVEPVASTSWRLQFKKKKSSFPISNISVLSIGDLQFWFFVERPVVRQINLLENLDVHDFSDFRKIHQALSRSKERFMVTVDSRGPFLYLLVDTSSLQDALSDEIELLSRLGIHSFSCASLLDDLTWLNRSWYLF